MTVPEISPASESSDQPSAEAADGSSCGSTCCCRQHRGRGWRSRWAAIGAALAVIAGTGGVAWSGASISQVNPSQTFITPCRIMDTRPAPNTVGPRSTPLAGGETHTIQVTRGGLNSRCNIPRGASGVVMNVTVVGPGANGFLTVFPEINGRPTAANINYSAGQAPVSNLVETGLDGVGQLRFFASGGPVNLIADISGFVTSARLSDVQVNQQRWDLDRAKPATITVGSSSRCAASDGSLVWVTNGASNSVTRIDPATNTLFGGSIPVGSGPTCLAFDGTQMWVANSGSSNVTRVNVATGTVVGAPINVGLNPFGVVFDGASIWVSNITSNTVTRIDAATATVTGTVPVGTSPTSITYDGTSVWTANSGSNNVSRISVETGALTGTFAAGTGARGIAFDGANIWVANRTANTVVRLNPFSGAVVGSPIGVGAEPFGVAFDGGSIWVANSAGGSVTRIDAATGSVIGTAATGVGPFVPMFDGANIWVPNFGATTVTKLRAS
ncbi:MAG: hypothetical protein ACOYML_03695 [Microthrixaceae bacterium]